MTTLHYILLLQLVLVFILAVLLYFNKRVFYFGFTIIFCQMLVLFIVLIKRILNSGGVDIGLLLYMSILPAFLPMLINLLKKNKQGLLKEIVAKVAKNLHIAVFNIFFLNQGFFYYSRLIFNKITLRAFKLFLLPNTFVFFTIFIPWGIFVICLFLEFLFLDKVYLSLIFFTLNMLIYRLLNFIFEIVKQTTEDGLNYVNAHFFVLLTNSSPDSLPVFFQKLENWAFIQNEENAINSVGPAFFSAVNFSSLYFHTMAIKSLIKRYRIIFNQLTFIICFILFSLTTLDISIIIFYSFFLIFNLCFLLNREFTVIDELLVQQRIIIQKITDFRTMLINSNILLEKGDWIIPDNEKYKPHNIIFFFKSLEFMITLNPPSSKNKYYLFILVPIFFYFILIMGFSENEAFFFFCQNFYLFNNLFFEKLKLLLLVLY